MEFENSARKDVPESSVWRYFLRGIKNRGTAKCIKCSKVIKCEGASTSGMKKHLKSMHDINLDKRTGPAPSDDDNQQPSTSSAKKSSIVKYFSRTSPLDAVLARLAAKDNISFNTICKSEDIRQGLLARGFNDIPKTPRGVKLKVESYCNFVIEEYRKQFRELQAQNRKLSLTFDEWTSVRNRRYMNVNVHDSNRMWNLGLVRIRGSMNAEQCIQLLEQKLSEFGLVLSKDIMGQTTDGALFMKKVGRLTSADHQVCLAHGIHLAVTSVLYQKPSSNTDNLIDDEDSDSDATSDGENSDPFALGLDLGSSSDVAMKPQYFPTVKKVRDIVKVFRLSPVKNDDVLQKYVREDKGKELSLILDCKTRWNSLLAMLKRFYEIRTAVQKAMIDLKGQVKVNFLADDEMELVREMIDALDPVNAAVEQLCRQHCTLYEADIALHFMLEQLSSQNTDIANELFEALKERIKERRFEYADLFAFLSNPAARTTMSNNFGTFSKTARSVLIKQADDLLKRLKACHDNEIEETVDETPPNDDNAQEDNDDNLTMKEKFEKRLQQLKAAPASTSSITPGLLKTLRNEFSYLETEGLKGKYLTMLFEALSTVRPTSVDSERAFSVSGNFATKIRSRIEDNTLNVLCILKAYFCNQ